MLTLLLFSCDIDEYTFDYKTQLKEDVNIINDYIDKQALEAYSIDSTGVHISFTAQDSSSLLHPTFRDDSHLYVTIKYKGYLTDGTVFDQRHTEETTELKLRENIAGWQIGIPEMTIGDSATLLIPSFYGHGDTDWTRIPANSVLLFDIYLESFEYKTY